MPSSTCTTRLAGGCTSANALGREKSIVNQEVAGETAGRLLEYEIGRVRHDCGRARHPHHPLAAEQILDGRRRNGGARP